MSRGQEPNACSRLIAHFSLPVAHCSPRIVCESASPENVLSGELLLRGIRPYRRRAWRYRGSLHHIHRGNS